jgi:hypothetical protein
MAQLEQDYKLQQMKMPEKHEEEINKVDVAMLSE